VSTEETPPLSLTELRAEYTELKKDFIAFTTAYDTVCRRIRESTEIVRLRNPQLHVWSGSRAVCGSLELAVHAIERAMAGYMDLILKVETGEIRNSDKPSLTVVDGGIE
jgi:hypothetical protein